MFRMQNHLGGPRGILSPSPNMIGPKSRIKLSRRIRSYDGDLPEWFMYVSPRMACHMPNECTSFCIGGLL